MINIKNIIKKHFNGATLCYDLSANVQRRAADYLVASLLNFDINFYPDSILDVGTGTGYVPKKLLKYFPDSNYVLNDLAEKMIQHAQLNFSGNKNIAFCAGDIEGINIDFHSLIISNMALQWTSNFNNIIKKLFNSSNIFAFSCLLRGTFKEWNNIFNKLAIPLVSYDYPNKLELEQALLSLNPKKYFFNTANYILQFNGALDFMQYLKNLGANTAYGSVSVNNLKKLVQYKHKFNITYKIFFGILQQHLPLSQGT